ncbi:MAG: cupin domain-containing protein [Pyrinomonadaceae bacterium]
MEFRGMRASEALEKLHGTDSEFVELFSKGKTSVEIYSPVGEDKQTPHDRDEFYVIVSGTGIFSLDGDETAFGPGDLLFVKAGVEHRFVEFTDDFSTWVIFVG